MSERFSSSIIPSLFELSQQSVSKVLERFAAQQAQKAQAAAPQGESGPVRNLGSSILTVIDGTCGNGQDTLFMAQTMAQLANTQPFAWQVLAFDVQEEALERARIRLTEAGLLKHVLYIHDGHEHLVRYLGDNPGGDLPDVLPNVLPDVLPDTSPGTSPDVLPGASDDTQDNALGQRVAPAGTSGSWPVAVAMYNLGFLPGGDRTLVTRKETTLISLSAALNALAPGGLLVVHAYGGHPGGRDEAEAVEAWFCGLDSALATVVRYTVCNKPRNPETLYLAEKL